MNKMACPSIQVPLYVVEVTGSLKAAQKTYVFPTELIQFAKRGSRNPLFVPKVFKPRNESEGGASGAHGDLLGH
jgi:hypothetical protein